MVYHEFSCVFPVLVQTSVLKMSMYFVVMHDMCVVVHVYEDNNICVIIMSYRGVICLIVAKFQMICFKYDTSALLPNI